MLETPGAVQRAVEEWESRSGRGLVTAVLCRHARDGSRRDWGKHVDAHLIRAQHQLARTPVSYARVAETLIAAELSFELLVEIHAGLLTAATDADRAVRRRLGLDSAAGGRPPRTPGRRLSAN